MPSVYYPWLRLGGYFFVFFTVTIILDYPLFVKCFRYEYTSVRETRFDSVVSFAWLCLLAKFSAIVGIAQAVRLV